MWATIQRRDGYLWEEEVVEAFMNPDGDGRNYKEFEANPLGTIMDLDIECAGEGRVPDVDRYRKCNCRGWQAAVHVDGTVDKGCAVEMAIPLRELTGAACRKRAAPGECNCSASSGCRASRNRNS